MKQRNAYQTKQTAEILQSLESIPNKHLTVSEICTALKDKDISIGTTTVYRHLEKLAADGLVTRYVVNGSSSAYFEYTHPSVNSYYHFQCEKCHRLLHVPASSVSSDGSGFSIDPMKTVLYGICDDCAEKDKKK